MDVQAWLDAYASAWRERDAEAAAGLFTEDVVYRSHPFREPDVGRDGVRAYWRGATAMQSDIDVRFGESVVEGDRATIEWWTTMRADGEETTIVGCLLLRFAADGRCEELREYWHVEPGRHEPHAGWGR